MTTKEHDEFDVWFADMLSSPWPTLVCFLGVMGVVGAFLLFAILK